MPRRNDATLVKEIKIYNKMFPYLMPKRTGSIVYFMMEIDVTRAVTFIHQKNRAAGEKRYRLFDVVLAALARTITLRPALNRFVANYNYWQRKELSFNFVVKKDLSEQSPERNAIVKVQPEMTFDEISAVIRERIDQLRNSEESGDEAIIKFFLKMPKWFLKLATGCLKWMDRHGCYPKALREVDGLHVSAYLANLGSINISNPPLHHLYEWGTTSLFVSMGKMHRSRKLDEQDNEQIKDTLDLGVTIDERIAEGFYFMKAIKLLQYYMENPSELEEPLNQNEIH
ncbi:MAG: 2-oxoacid:acceptor oxidoreductase [Spirochaetota bacterium]